MEYRLGEKWGKMHRGFVSAQHCEEAETKPETPLRLESSPGSDGALPTPVAGAACLAGQQKGHSAMWVAA